MLKTPDKALQWPVSNKPVKKDGPLKKLNAERDLSQLIYNKCVDKGSNYIDISKLDLVKHVYKEHGLFKTVDSIPKQSSPLKDIIEQNKSVKDDDHRTSVINRTAKAGEISK